ncbi:hypothetical protein ITJ57_05650 [Plantibacter sp. VKM Ac-2880]|uniref:hypothetical protein n=1 Tax=Plantibacter sp. VKM Ac-2880 TaxID=2783827 RepID=UPI0018909B2A|nr:hypothetical protein [Plantibacter sp. VKM Ac-2880]MBF4568249.1 hypothetical protein [Plantibacter sp. VKM Ac-2880]
MHMHIALASDSAAAIDSTALALLSIFGGAGVTILAGFIGAGIQGRREHNRWVSAHRYEAFVKAFALMKGFQLIHSKSMKLAQQKGMKMDSPELVALLAESDQLYITVAETLAPLVILGPTSVSEHADAMQAAFEASDYEALREAERAFVLAARTVLKIRA